MLTDWRNPAPVRLSANLSFLFREHALPMRFEFAARCGFRAVECNFIYDMPVADVQRRLSDNGLELALINVAPGPQAGDMGLAAAPGREAEAAALFAQALDYAVGAKASAIHYLAGRRRADADAEAADAAFLDNLVRDADLAAREGVLLMLEPLNAVDRPDYHLVDIQHARRLIAAANRPNIRLQLDLYHCAMRGEDVIHAINDNLALIGHVQIAGAPGRHEPVDGAADHHAPLARLAQSGYAGWIGCEYEPVADTVNGLAWAQHYLRDDAGRRHA
jgi:hydroxypyruvate isomerase